MDKNILNTIILAGSFLALFVAAELLYHTLKIKVEFTRKFVHIGTGFLTLLFPVMIDNHWLVLLLCSSFALILIFSLKYNLLRSINAIERESVGSIAYPISVYGCYLVYQYFHQHLIYFYLPIIILALCDPIAALTGKRWAIGKFKVGKENKTMMGSTMFLVSAFALAVPFTLQKFEVGMAILTGLCIALVSAISEAMSRNGYDNITIPASVLTSLLLLEHYFI